jgi:hypothetical protein
MNMYKSLNETLNDKDAFKTSTIYIIIFFGGFDSSPQKIKYKTIGPSIQAIK